VANTRSARKRIRQNEKRRLRNRAVRSAVRSSVKNAREALAGKAPEAATPEAARLVREAIRALDRAVTQGIVHRNTAARRKSALARKLNAPA
jgi:small subunit ribosomal protein S20